MNTRTGILFASILLSAAAVSGCGLGEARNAPAAPPAAQVTTAVVATQELSDWADFTGRLEAVENVAVRPRVGGYVDTSQFTEGARVAQGDLLFQIDPRPFKAEVERLVRRARSRRGRARARALVQRPRAQRLLAQNATSREEYEQLDSRRGGRAGAGSGGRGAALEAAKLNLSFTRVTAPIAGRVVARRGDRGQPRRQLDAADDRRVRLAGLRVLRRRRADLSRERARAATRLAGSTVQSGSATSKAIRIAARLDFLDNQRRPDARHDSRARGARQRGRPFTPGLFVRIKLVSAAALSRGARRRPCDRHRSRPQVRVRRRRAQRRRIPPGGDGQVRRRVARDHAGPRRRRHRDRQRPATRSARASPVNATQVAMDRDSPGALSRLAANTESFVTAHVAR